MIEFMTLCTFSVNGIWNEVSVHLPLLFNVFKQTTKTKHQANFLKSNHVRSIFYYLPEALMFHRGKMIRCLSQNIISDFSKLLFVFFLIIEIYFPQKRSKGRTERM